VQGSATCCPWVPFDTAETVKFSAVLRLFEAVVGPISNRWTESCVLYCVSVGLSDRCSSGWLTPTSRAAEQVKRCRVGLFLSEKWSFQSLADTLTEWGTTKRCPIFLLPFVLHSPWVQLAYMEQTSVISLPIESCNYITARNSRMLSIHNSHPIKKRVDWTSIRLMVSTKLTQCIVSGSTQSFHLLQLSASTIDSVVAQFSDETCTGLAQHSNAMAHKLRWSHITHLES